MEMLSRIGGWKMRRAVEPVVQEDLRDSALVERCRKQDFEAFGKFVDAYQARVFGFVRRSVATADDAADVTQEVFIRAFQSFPSFDGRGSVRTWLFRIAHNLCIDRARKRDRRVIEASMFVGDDAEEFETPDERWQPEKLALNDELNAVVEQGIQELSLKLRTVLLLHDREDMEYEEIAKLVSVPVGTVKSRLFLARKHLQAKLSAYLAAEGAA